MRRNGIWLSVLAMAMCAGSVSATPIVIGDNSWNDWFSYGGNTANPNWLEGLVSTTNVNIRTAVDEEFPTPGGGGQDFDIEEMFYYYDDADPNSLTGGTFYIGMVTGYNPAGVDNIEAGDLFIGFGAGGPANDLAIAVGTDDVNRFGDAWFNSGSPLWTTTDVIYPQFAISNPYRVDENVAGATPVGGVTVDWFQVGTHWFMEVGIDVDGALEDVLTNQNGGVSLHWTMECGNDNINVIDNTPFTPVPEPATMMLFGMGVLGIALRSRRPQC
jgi:hypothetical protein